MIKKILLIMMALGIAFMVLWAAMAFGPGMLANYHIQKIDVSNEIQSLRAMENLRWMGRWSVPSLYDAAMERDAEIKTARQLPCPITHYGGPLDWLAKMDRRMNQSPIEKKAVLCTALLTPAWNANRLSEVQKRRLMPYLVGYAASLPDVKFQLDSNRLNVAVGSYRWIGSHVAQEEIWLKDRFVIVVDGTENHPALNKFDQAWWNKCVIEAKPPGVGQTLENRLWGGAGSDRMMQYKLDTDNLSVGKHVVTVRVLVGPGEATTRGWADSPPPWHDTVLLGPLEFEVEE